MLYARLVLDGRKLIKIKRSNGRVQYVTREELDELNLARKQRDQSVASAKPKNLLAQLAMICMLISAITAGFLISPSS